VVGVVEDKGGDFYKVNIFAGAPALLDRLAFDGATKRNKPELRRGDIVYARVTMADRDLDTELSCMVSSGPKKDWSSGECVSGFVVVIERLLYIDLHVTIYIYIARLCMHLFPYFNIF
jgi:exosome complex component RRP40